LSRFLSEKGLQAGPLATRWTGEADDAPAADSP
jgi:hypothetical protein